MRSFFLPLQTIQERNAKLVEFLKNAGVADNIINAATNVFQLMALKAQVKFLPDLPFTFETVAGVTTAEALVNFANQVTLMQAKNFLMTQGVDMAVLQNINSNFPLYAIALYKKFAPDYPIDYERAQTVMSFDDLNLLLDEIKDLYIDTELVKYGVNQQKISALTSNYAKKALLFYKTEALGKNYTTTLLNSIDTDVKLEALKYAVKLRVTYNTIAKFINNDQLDYEALATYMFGYDQATRDNLVNSNPSIAFDLKQLFSLNEYNFSDPRSKELLPTLRTSLDVAYFIMLKNARNLGIDEYLPSESSGNLLNLLLSSKYINKTSFENHLQVNNITLNERVMDRILHPFFPLKLAEELGEGTTAQELYAAFNELIHPSGFGDF